MCYPNCNTKMERMVKMKTDLYCQSCGMPMTEDAHFGTHADGSRSEDYCCYCFKNGAFQQDCTMEEMIDFCLEVGKDSGMYTDREEARGQMLAWFPTLKRWKENQGEA